MTNFPPPTAESGLAQNEGKRSGGNINNVIFADAVRGFHILLSIAPKNALSALVAPPSNRT